MTKPTKYFITYKYPEELEYWYFSDIELVSWHCVYESLLKGLGHIDRHLVYI